MKNKRRIEENLIESQEELRDLLENFQYDIEKRQLKVRSIQSNLKLQDFWIEIETLKKKIWSE